MNLQAYEIWWKTITGPQSFVKRVVDTLLDYNMPLLNLPADLPWRHGMRNAVLDAFREASPDEEPYIETIDATDDCPEEEVGDFLLNRFASRDVASCYRPKSGDSIQQYLIKNKVLSNKILWIKGIKPEDVTRWINFCCDYHSLSLSSGLFIIENCSSGIPIMRGRFVNIDFTHFISHYDVQLFNRIMLSSQNIPLATSWQNYIAVAAANLCDFDAELSEALIQHQNWQDTDPLQALKIVAGLQKFAQRGTGCDTHHAISCLRQNRAEELNRRLWAAQIQVLFPIIERQRIDIVTQLEDDLHKILARCTIEQFKQRVKSAQEVELGTLAFLLTLQDQNGKRELYVPDDALRKKIYLLRDCRNKLAHHHQCCSPEQVDNLLQLNCA